MPYDINDIHSAELCAWKEARGEGIEGMKAVLCVLKNRVGFTGFAHTLHDVIYGKNQFTSMSVPSDPEFNLQPPAVDDAFSAALDIATALLEADISEDITNGAHYYANLHVIPKDGWFYRNIVLNTVEHRLTAQIGKHTFFW